MSDSVPLYGFGGGGVALNFDVKQYATEAQLLAATPKENTIGVITTTAIAGWYFTAEQPENMMEGGVWFLTGTSSPVAFNALKKNAVQVYPLSAKQYVNGVLEYRPAKIYQSGKWVDRWNGELYYAGNEYTDITGGWKVQYYDGPASFSDGTATKNTSSIKMTSGENAYVSVISSNLIDISQYSVIKINITAISVGTKRTVALLLIDKNGGEATFLEPTSKETASLDISNLSGKYKVKVECYNDGVSTPASITFDKIWLE